MEVSIAPPSNRLDPLYGRQALATVLDVKATITPSKPLAYIPRSNTPSDGWRAITFKEVSNAINHVASDILTRWKSTLSQDEFPTFAYIGPNDIRYFIIMFACIKAGCKAFFPSPRNSVAEQLSLLQATNCSFLGVTESMMPFIKPLLQAQPLTIIIVPEAEAWLSAPPVSFGYSKKIEQSSRDPLVVVHTSGSTGMPKPVILRQGSAIIGEACLGYSDYDGAPIIWKYFINNSQRPLLLFPFFHAAGLFSTIMIALFGEKPVVFPLPDRLLNDELAIQYLTYSGSDAAFIPPSIVEDLAGTEDGIEILAKLNFIGTGGAKLSTVAGNLLTSRGAKLMNGMSSTECLPYLQYVPKNPDLWEYMVIDSEAMGAKWLPIDRENTVYRLHFSRKQREPGYQAVFYTFPELSEWSTGDLFQRHSTLSDHWVYHGRADNMIVFSNGEKLNPAIIEETISNHSSVKSALVAGQNKFQACLILEPVVPPLTDAEAENFVAQIWPTIQAINDKVAAHSRISRHFILISREGKPFSRTAKGSIRRRQTLQAYEDEIEVLYQFSEDEKQLNDVIHLDFSDESTLIASIIKLFTAEIGIETLHPDTDFFAVGMDSRQVISLAKALWLSGRHTRKLDVPRFSPSLIYKNPTAQLLAKQLKQIATGADNFLSSDETSEVYALESLVAKYTKKFPPPKKDQEEPFKNGQTILLTGTTGSLGSYLLSALICCPQVTKIVALNRDHDGGKARQLHVNSERSLNMDLSEVQFYCVDLSKPKFGLNDEDYYKLLLDADRFIHNAWPVNYNLSVASFEPSIRGVRRIVDFVSEARKKIPILFLSSTATVEGWDRRNQVPETSLNNPGLAYMGYGRSKLAGSMILDAAVQRSGLVAASIRMGQVAGPKAGMGIWDKNSWIPSLITSSIHLGVLPAHLSACGMVNWTPIEDMVGMVLDIAGITVTSSKQISGYLNVVNPELTSWKILASAIMDSYRGKIHELVDLESWVHVLELSAKAENPDLQKNPAIKLLDTFKEILAAYKSGRGQLKFEVNRAKALSPTMACLQSVTPDLMKNWCAQWEP